MKRLIMANLFRSIIIFSVVGILLVSQPLPSAASATELDPTELLERTQMAVAYVAREDSFEIPPPPNDFWQISLYDQDYIDLYNTLEILPLGLGEFWKSHLQGDTSFETWKTGFTEGIEHGIGIVAKGYEATNETYKFYESADKIIGTIELIDQIQSKEDISKQTANIIAYGFVKGTHNKELTLKDWDLIVDITINGQFRVYRGSSLPVFFTDNGVHMLHIPSEEERSIVGRDNLRRLVSDVHDLLSGQYPKYYPEFSTILVNQYLKEYADYKESLTAIKGTFLDYNKGYTTTYPLFVDSIKIGETLLTGSATEGDIIEVSRGGTVIGTAVAGENGTFSFNIPVLQLGETLEITSKDTKGILRNKANVIVNGPVPLDENLKKVLKEMMHLPLEKITLMDMHSLSNLPLDLKEIDSLEGIEYAKNLKYLDLSRNPVTSLELLKKLPNLRVLNITGANAALFYPDQKKVIQELKDKGVKVIYDDLADRIFNGFVWEKLKLPYNTEVTKEHLGQLSSLEGSVNYSYVGWGPYMSLEGIQYAKNLQVLNMWSSRIKYLDELANLPQLKELRLANNEISNLEPLKELENLETIDLSDNNIEDISYLKDLDLLKNLNISQNPIKDLSPLLEISKLADVTMHDVDLTHEDIVVIKQLKAKGINVIHAPSIPIVNKITDQDEQITGKAELAQTIQVTNKAENMVVGHALVDNEGNFTILISKQTAGTELEILASTENGLTSIISVTIEKGKPSPLPPEAPIVNEVSDRSSTVTGKAKAETTIVIETAGKSYTGIVKEDGGFSIPIDIQKVGTIITVYAKDALGNLSSKVTVVVTDKTAPKVSGVSNNAYYNKDVKITFNEGKATLNGSAFKSETIVKNSGTYTLIVTDSAGNKTMVKFTIDKTAPKVSGVSTNAYYNKDVKITFNEGKATLNGSAFKSETIVKNSGTYTLIVTDTAGNKTIVKFTIDKTAPKVSGVSNNAYYNKDVKITFNEGIATLNGYSFKSGTYVKTGKAYTLVVIDSAGNKTTVKFTIDKTPPAAPKVNTIKTSFKTVTGSAEAYSFISIKAGTKVIGTTTADRYGKYKVTIPLQNRNTIIYVTAKDKSGNLSKATKTVVL
ncbi:Internalin-A precursor [Mycobacteroides abscessus subsp. abscessus]|nr:Internalin-A precursor [Mycobacteroides abscessus subsp. abscessus]